MNITEEFKQVAEGTYRKAYKYYYFYLFCGPPYSSKPKQCVPFNEYKSFEMAITERLPHTEQAGRILDVKMMNHVGIAMNCKDDTAKRLIIVKQRLSDIDKDITKAKPLPYRLKQINVANLSLVEMRQIENFVQHRLFAYFAGDDKYEKSVSDFLTEAKEITNIICNLPQECHTSVTLLNLIYNVLYHSFCYYWLSDGTYGICNRDHVARIIGEKSDYWNFANELRSILSSMKSQNVVTCNTKNSKQAVAATG